MVNRVATISPPMMATAIGPKNTLRDSGIIARTAASAVSTIGRKRRTVDSMIATTERGLYVSAFNYCRVLDPKSLAVTGLTRNGTFMIENGRITGAVTNLRFTQSFVSALTAVDGLGDDGRFADSEFGAGLVHAPSVRLAAWNFTGGAGG